MLQQTKQQLTQHLVCVYVWELLYRHAHAVPRGYDTKPVAVAICCGRLQPINGNSTPPRGISHKTHAAANKPNAREDLIVLLPRSGCHLLNLLAVVKQKKVESHTHKSETSPIPPTSDRPTYEIFLDRYVYVVHSYSA